MSNIGKKPVALKPGVDIKIEQGVVMVNGPKGSLSMKIPSGIEVMVEEDKVRVKKSYDSKNLEKYYGLMRAMVNNMVHGVSQGFEKKLELLGVGYRARVDGRDLVLNVGYANPVKISPPEGITITVAEHVITVAGINKQIVGDVCANIRKVRPPDAYKGKGIRIQGEKIRKKVGKAAKAVGK